MAKRPNRAEQLHMARVAGLPCLACGARPVCVHHVIGYADRPGRLSKDHRLVTPLCPRHHDVQHGPRSSVEALGHRGFYDAYGIDLLAEARWLEQESIALGILPELREAA
jgi:Protein of unknown function (DUF968).